MSATLRLTHRLFSIDGVPDNLVITQGETFTLEVINDGQPSHDPVFRFFTDNDWVLNEQVPPAVNVRSFIAAAAGQSTIQLQFIPPNGNVPVIDRAYVVTVVSADAVSATLADRGRESVGAER